MTLESAEKNENAENTQQGESAGDTSSKFSLRTGVTGSKRSNVASKKSNTEKTLDSSSRSSRYTAAIESKNSGEMKHNLSSNKIGQKKFAKQAGVALKIKHQKIYLEFEGLARIIGESYKMIKFEVFKMEDEQCALSGKLNRTSLTKVSFQIDQKMEEDRNGSWNDSVKNHLSAFSATQLETELTMNTQGFPHRASI